jgi:hypothetical protein
MVGEVGRSLYNALAAGWHVLAGFGRQPAGPRGDGNAPESRPTLTALTLPQTKYQPPEAPVPTFWYRSSPLRMTKPSWPAATRPGLTA